MRDPKPINLTTTEEVKAAGWAAEARDSDGHLVSMVSPQGNVRRVVSGWIAEGLAVTVFPKEGRADAD